MKWMLLEIEEFMPNTNLEFRTNMVLYGDLR
jgi:hypothetical protein